MKPSPEYTGLPTSPEFQQLKVSLHRTVLDRLNLESIQQMEREAAVQGIRWINPPSDSRSRVPVAFCTAPAPRNSNALNTAWLST